MLGCGYEVAPPPDKRMFVQPWAGLGYSGPKVETCPGYTINLPETIEIARRRFHWLKGGLASVGVDPDHPIAAGIEVLECSANDCLAWRSTPRSKGGGAD